MWKKVTVVVDTGAAKHVMPRSMFPRYPPKKRKGPRMEKGFKGPEGDR